MVETPSKPVAESYKRWAGTESFDAIVIGSGIGGLWAAPLCWRSTAKSGCSCWNGITRSAASRMSFIGPGTNGTSACITWAICSPAGLLRSVFDDLRMGKLEWADMGPVYDRVSSVRRTFDFPKGKEQLKAALVGRFPGEAAAIERYF